MPPPRTPWLNFPDVYIHAAETAVKQHPRYGAAKSGDADAAAELVAAAFNVDQTQAMANLIAGLGVPPPTLVSAHAYESEVPANRLADPEFETTVRAAFCSHRIGTRTAESARRHPPPRASSFSRTRRPH